MYLMSCHQTETATSSQSRVSDSVANESETIKKISENQPFLDKYRTVELDTLHFVAPRYDEGKIGRDLTDKDLELFPETLVLDSFWGEDAEFQAFLKFEVDENLLGLMTRMPGEYAFTSMKLFFYDLENDQMLPTYYEVADEMGDAGYSMEKKSWVYREGNQVKSFTYHMEKEDKIEPDDPTIPWKKERYYIVDLNPEKMDTIESDLAKMKLIEK